ncbi:DegT/DnrJ/EryC1/StrS family aminotransferase [Bacteroidota bacterium]
MKIPFSPPYIDESVINEVVDTLKSGWITTGPKVKALENEIRQFTNSRQVLCVNSWTSAAIMILKWLGVKKGDEVIVPAYTYSATAIAVFHAGATPIMVDVNEDFNISMVAISSAITAKTKAIIPVDFAGWPCNYIEIMNLVNQPEVKSLFIPSSSTQEKLGRIMIISDAAHSIGAMYSDKYVGYQSDIVIFSLHAVKNITTAEGGAICFNMPESFDNQQLYTELRLMSLNCQTKDAYTKSDAGGWRYDITGLGMKINMADLNAAVGLAQIKKYSKLLFDRKHIAEYYSQKLSHFEWAVIPPLKADSKESSYHLFPLRIKGISESERDIIIKEVSNSGVALNVHFIPLPMLTLFKGLGYRIEDYPVSYDNYSREISLPIYPQLTIEQINYILAQLEKAYKNVVLK